MRGRSIFPWEYCGREGKNSEIRLDYVWRGIIGVEFWNIDEGKN